MALRLVASGSLAVACAACGRSGFTPLFDGAPVADAPAGVPHVQVATGFTASVLVDLTGIVPYNPNDFFDGGMIELDNAPVGLAALYAPFPSILAVCAGRSIIELGADFTPTVHNYRPATPDTTGPDSCAHLVFGAPPDVGPALWIGAGSQQGGDGLYYVTPGWGLTREFTNNNVNGVGYDATGAFDGLGTPSIYFVDVNDVLVRTGAGTSAQVIAEPQTDSMGGQIALTASAAYIAQTPGSNGATSTDVDRIAATSHNLSSLASATNFGIADVQAAGKVPALRDNAALAAYADDGTSTPIAASLDPAWVWVAAAAPSSPHPLAGSYIVLESNRTLDRDELLLIAPAP